jgi:hypothetical protein
MQSSWFRREPAALSGRPSHQREAYIHSAGAVHLFVVTHFISSPLSSIRGSFPKDLAIKVLQSVRGGLGRRFCPKSAKTVSKDRSDRGASSPKYRIPCRPSSCTCCIRMWRNFSREKRRHRQASFLVSFAKYSTVLSLRILRRYWAMGGRRMYLPA